jgi:hypothetical protein
MKWLPLNFKKGGLCSFSKKHTKEIIDLDSLTIQGHRSASKMESGSREGETY